MKRNNLLAGVLLLSAILYTDFSSAQEKQSNCAVNLKEAQTLYQSGKFEAIPEMITGCLRSGFTSEEKIQAYKLLINCCIFANNTAKAEEYMFEFLRLYPEYEVIATDPNEFTDLMNQFDNRPRFSYGLIAGGNLSFIRVQERISTYSSDIHGKYSPSGIGFQAGLMISKNITEKIDVNLEAIYKQTAYSFSLNNPSDGTHLNYIEKQSLYQIPVSATYTFMERRFSPYARIGLICGYLNSSAASGVVKYSGNVANDITGKEINQIDKRNGLNFWTIVGAGVRYKISKGYLRADVRYNLSLKNQVNNKSWLDSQNDLIWLYRYAESKTYRDDLTFSIGYVRTVYHPRKK